MERKLNFNAGPAELPGEVLHELAKATHYYKKTGLSILELPHRSPEFLDIIEESKSLVRELCGISTDYEVVWLHGGGRMQFCMVPMNFLATGKTSAYLESGQWAQEALEYARYYGAATIAASSRDQAFYRLPDWPADLPAETAYLHITTNNTIHGTQWRHIPATTAPLIADMSSDILSRRHDYSRYAMFYATAQKNLGVAGVALAVIHKSMLTNIARPLPPILSYKEQVRQNSVVNTANVYGIYTALLMLRWIKEKGIDNLERDNLAKAAMLYNLLDSSKVFKPCVKEVAHRSTMNICFTAATKELERTFLQLCDRNNITGIAGHRSTGGFRVSNYNAISVDDVAVLADLMKQFDARHGR